MKNNMMYKTMIQWVTVVALLACLAVRPVSAGAWGEGSFDNDSALDWVENELRVHGSAAIRRAVAPIASGSRYVDADEASSVVTACEVLAAWQGRPAKDLPDFVAAIVKRFSGEPREELREMARKALDRVVRDSELKDLWAEGGGEPFEAWKRAMAELRGRL
ncbi:hypothetical protein ASA1KI_14500 [Opitutales bacterium ASA1]|uniref:DUF4259 domain-containing protein n=1 Tax=Congregicoccus parvus TaxID=3081749 RepID=UPI002B321BE7|nr:hypothetical protein ASA1KI_14500 [Opitutales bacterium ASA1]